MGPHPVPYEEEEIRTQRCTGGPRETRGEMAIYKPGGGALEETNAAKHLDLGVWSQSSRNVRK